VGSALSPEAQRQRGASGSCSHATPIHSGTLGRGRHSYSQMMPVAPGSSSAGGGTAAAGTALGVQEIGAGQLQLLAGSGSSLEVLIASRQALAVYAADDEAVGRLPVDWQRLHQDRDIRVSGRDRGCNGRLRCSAVQ
jgi:hypothetical protein